MKQLKLKAKEVKLTATGDQICNLLELGSTIGTRCDECLAASSMDEASLLFPLVVEAHNRFNEALFALIDPDDLNLPSVSHH